MKHHLAAGTIATTMILGFGCFAVPQASAADTETNLIEDSVLQQCIADNLAQSVSFVENYYTDSTPIDSDLSAAIDTVATNAAAGMITQTDLDTFAAVDVLATGAVDDIISKAPPGAGLGGLSAGQLMCSGISSLAGLENLHDPNLLRLSVTGSSDADKTEGISDLTPIAGLTSLTSLYVDSNSITRLEPLSGLTSLAYLSLNFNQVSDLTPLAGLTALQSLSIAGNPVTDLSPLGDLTALRNVTVAGDSISDLSTINLCTEAMSSAYLSAVLAGNYDVAVPECAIPSAAFQTLTGTAVAGSPVPLPQVVGQSDDPVTWRAVSGSGPITFNDDDTVTYGAGGTYVLQFQDTTAAGNSLWLSSELVPNEATCIMQNGEWGVHDGNNESCMIEADFSGIVTVTVAAPDGDNPGGSTVITPPTSEKPSLEVITGGAVLGSAALPAVAIVVLVLGIGAFAVSRRFL